MHIARVLRMRRAKKYTLRTGGTTSIARVFSRWINRRFMRNCLALCVHGGARASFYAVSGASQGGKMEVIIQKCVELGVSRIAPVLTERCVVRPDGDFERKRLRYQRVAYEAAKQSGRAVIPQVTGLVFSCGNQFCGARDAAARLRGRARVRSGKFSERVSRRRISR